MSDRKPTFSTWAVGLIAALVIAVIYQGWQLQRISSRMEDWPPAPPVSQVPEPYAPVLALSQNQPGAQDPMRPQQTPPSQQRVLAYNQTRPLQITAILDDPYPFPNLGFAHANAWNPFEQIQRMREHMDRVFGGALLQMHASPRYNNLIDIQFPMSPRIDVTENDGNYVISVDLPGVDANAIETQLDGQVLTIQASMDSSDEATFDTGQGNIIQRERRIGTFMRSLRLPEAVDAQSMQTEYKDGVLRVTIAKAQLETEA